MSELDKYPLAPHQMFMPQFISACGHQPPRLLEDYDKALCLFYGTKRLSVGNIIRCEAIRLAIKTKCANEFAVNDYTNSLYAYCNHEGSENDWRQARRNILVDMGVPDSDIAGGYCVSYEKEKKKFYDKIMEARMEVVMPLAMPEDDF